MDSRSPVDGAQGNQGAPPPPPGPGIQQQQPQQPHRPNPHEPAPQAPAPQGQWPQAAPPPPGGPGLPGLPGQASRQPNPKRRKGLIIAGSVTAGLLVILGVGGFFGYKHLSETTYSPRVQAEEYLQALVDADVERAMEMAPATGDELDYSLMTNEIYSKATDRISGFEVTDVVVNDGTADVSVDVKQGDDTQAMKLELSENGTEAVLFKKWKLDAPLGSWSLRYTLDADASEPAVNGVSVEMPEDGKKLAVLPGEYTFNAPTGTKFVSYGGDEKMAVRLDGQESLMGVGFIPELTDAAREEIKAQTRAHLESCLKLTELQPKGCPNQADGEDPNNFRSIKWSMAKEPTYESIEGDPTLPFSVEAVNGQFTLDAEMKQGDEWGTMKGTVELYSMPAMVAIQGETITMAFAD